MSWIQIWKKNKVRYGWRHVSKACDNILAKYDGPLPTRVVALARGGLIPGTILANKLGVRHVYSLGLCSYEQQLDGTEAPGIFDVYQRIPSNIDQVDRQDRVLLVDDISDKGSTFKFAEQYIKDKMGGKIVTAALVIKPGTSYIPTYYNDIIDDNKWVIFPWEKF